MERTTFMTITRMDERKLTAWIFIIQKLRTKEKIRYISVNKPRRKGRLVTFQVTKRQQNVFISTLLQCNQKLKNF